MRGIAMLQIPLLILPRVRSFIFVISLCYESCKNINFLLSPIFFLDVYN